MKPGGFYSQQKIIRRRHVPYTGSRGDMFIIRWLSDIGSGILKGLKSLLSRLWDIMRFNPLFRKIAFASCIALVVTGAVF